MRRIKTAALPAAAIVLALAGRAANAGSTTASLRVTATVQSTCAASADLMPFATYTPAGRPVTPCAAITVRCSSGLGFKVELGPGVTPGANIRQQGSIWGAGTTGVALTGTASSEGLPTSLTVFAEVSDSAVNQLVTPGIYRDLVTVTITY